MELGWGTSKRNAILLPIVLCFLNVFQLCSGLRCYQCQYMNGIGDRECLQEPPPSKFLVECNQPQCWKKYSHFNGNSQVLRFCVAAVVSQPSSCQPSTFEDQYGEILPATECRCNSKDGCNGSPLHQSSASYNGVMLISLGMMLFSRMALQDLLR